MTLVSRLEETKKSLEKIQQEALVFCANKEVPIEERWETFCQLGKVAPKTCSCVLHFSFEKKENLDWYSDLYVEKYETVSLTRILDRLEEEREEVTPERLEEIREEFLQCGCTHFVFDW